MIKFKNYQYSVCLVITSFLLLVIASKSVQAAQIKEIEDGGEFTAEISKMDLNRIKVTGDRIRDVKMNTGDLDISIDEKNGEVFIRAAHSVENKPINIFVITQQNFTYKGILYPRSIPAEQIILRNDSVPIAGGSFELSKVGGGKNSYEQQIIALFKAMRQNKRLDSYQVKNDKKYIDLGDLSMKRTSVYKGPVLTGETFTLKNSTNQVINLEEKIFFKNGIKAVKIEKRDLLPDESTEIYIIS